MDSQTAAVLAYCSIIITIGGTIISVINHKRLRSHCCGGSVEASIDIENTTPPIRDT